MMFIRNLDVARRVVKACKFGTNKLCWSRLSEGERMVLRDALVKAHYWGQDKLPKEALRDMEISSADQSSIDWEWVFNPVNDLNNVIVIGEK